MRVRFGSQAIAKLLIGPLIAMNCPELVAQTAPAKLFIVVLEGDEAVNSIRLRTAREPIVEVQDENHKPVAGAIVSFTLPNSGPSGLFSNGSRLLTVTTDANGRASATGLKANSVKGRFQIRVTASSQGRTAATTISQVNAASAAGASASGGLFGLGLPATLAIAGAIVAGVTVGVVKTRGGSQGTRVGVGTPTLP